MTALLSGVAADSPPALVVASPLALLLLALAVGRRPATRRADSTEAGRLAEPRGRRHDDLVRVTFTDDTGAAPRSVAVSIDHDSTAMTGAGSDYARGVLFSAAATPAVGWHEIRFCAVDSDGNGEDLSGGDLHYQAGGRRQPHSDRSPDRSPDAAPPPTRPALEAPLPDHRRRPCRSRPTGRRHDHAVTTSGRPRPPARLRPCGGEVIGGGTGSGSGGTGSGTGTGAGPGGSAAPGSVGGTVPPPGSSGPSRLPRPPVAPVRLGQAGDTPPSWAA